MIEAYPLCWPGDYPRTRHQKNSRFKITTAAARNYVKAEIKRIGGTNEIISSNIPVKKDGDLYASFTGHVKDSGVSVYFTRHKQQVVLCCDTYYEVTDNLYAIGRTIQALRQIDRDGVSDFLNRTFTGFKSLPAAAPWYSILQVPPTATENEAREAYRKLAMIHHPDKGGTADMFNQLSQAMKTAMQHFAGQ